MGVCVRRPHERILSALLDLVPGPTVPSADRSQEQLGLPICIEYALSRRVGIISQCWSP